MIQEPEQLTDIAAVEVHENSVSVSVQTAINNEQLCELFNDFAIVKFIR